ncbi:MAG: response regulator [Chloroflexota bacterium]
MNSTYKGTILIVDDTPANLRVLASLLENEGYETRLMPNGARALVSVQNAHPDLILLDIMMPDMDGYEVCAALKANEQTKDIPIIFISALDEVFDKVRAFSNGGVDYITKPFQDAEVLARVQTHLTLRHLQQELKEKNKALITINATLEDKVEARTIALKDEIKQRKNHQQEKDRLFELAQQQSEQLRSMTSVLLEAQQNQRQTLSTGLNQEIQQKITQIQSKLNAVQTLFSTQVDPQIAICLADIAQLLTEMESYLSQVSIDFDQATVTEQSVSDSPLLLLSAREREVLRLVVEGKTNPEIATLLTVTLSTVHTYLKRIRRKLDIQDIPGLVRFAQKHGLID